MKLSINELRELTADREYEFTLPESSFEFQGDEFVAQQPTEVRLRLHREGTSVSVKINIRGNLRVGCSRCLAPAEVPIAVSVEDVWPLASGCALVEDFFSSAFVEDDGQLVNLVEYSTEVLLENLPLRALCKAECKGLCESCGANQNEEECSCGKRDIDPRFAVLGRLLNDKGGVRDGTTKEKNLKGPSR